MSNLAHDDVITALPLKYTGRTGKGAVKLTRPKTSEIDDSKITIVHTMADGTVRDSIEGYVIPYNDKTAIIYELLVKSTIEKQSKADT